MKKLIVIYTLWCLIIPGICIADNAKDYYILHDTKLIIKYEAHNSIPPYKTTTRKGFKNQYNPKDPIVACGRESCSPGSEITFPSLSVEAQSSQTIYKKFRVFVPPGTTFLNLSITGKPGKDIRAAVRMNYAPQDADPASLSYTTQGTYELRYLDYTQINLQPADSQISIYNGTPYPLKDSINPLAEDHSGWIYVHILSGVENIQSINYSFTVNKMVYSPWYTNYYNIGQDTYGLDDQSTLPMVAANAGSQLLQSYGQQLAQKAIKELGVMFQDEAGQAVQSNLDSGEGTVVSYGCCGYYCCVGIGLMATPTGVVTAFGSFADQSIDSLDQMFESANEAFYLYWGLPITTELGKNRQAFSKLVKNQNQVLDDLFIGLGSAQAELEAQEQFGEFSLFDSTHLVVAAAKEIQIQKKAEPQLALKIYDKLKTYRGQFNNPGKIIDHHAKKKNEALTGQALIASDGTMDPDQLKAGMQMNEILLDPYPEINLPEAQQSSRSAQIYKVLQKIKKAQLIVSQYLYSANLAEQSPTISADAVNKIRASMGYTGAPLPKESRISSKAFMELLTDSKLANPNWYAEAVEKNQYGLSRESLILKAFSLEQELTQLFKLHRQTLLKAQIHAARINNNMNPELNQAFKNAVSN